MRGADGRRRPTLTAATYDRQAAFLAWANAAGYGRVYHPGGGYDPQPAGLYDVRDVNHDGAVRAGATGDYSTSEVTYFDFDGDGLLCDNERDEDADGLTNYDEGHGRTRRSYWGSQYPQEKPYLIDYAGTELDDADSDGDGVRDGADDQDHDDIANLAELSRHLATGDEPAGVAPRDPRGTAADPSQPQGRVNPFNPCLPNVASRTCLRHPPFGGDAPAPFDGSPNYSVFD